MVATAPASRLVSGSITHKLFVNFKHCVDFEWCALYYRKKLFINRSGCCFRVFSVGGSKDTLSISSETQ